MEDEFNQDWYKTVVVTSIGPQFDISAFYEGGVDTGTVGSIAVEGTVGLLMESTKEIVFENRVDVEIVDYTGDHDYHEGVISAGDGAMDMRI